MSVWDDIARGAAAIATGGASEIAIAVQQKEAEKRRRELQEQKQRSEEAQKRAFAAGRAAEDRVDESTPSVQINSCCRYQLDAPFLLDAHGGRVWRYDDQKKQFLIVPRESTAIEKSWESILAAKLTADAVDELAEVTKTSSRAEHLRVSNLVDSHIKVMDEHLKRLKPK